MSTASHPHSNNGHKGAAHPKRQPSAAELERRRNFRKHGLPAFIVAAVLGVGAPLAVTKGPKVVSEGVHWLDERNAYSKYSLDEAEEMRVKVTRKGEGVSTLVDDVYGRNMNAEHKDTVTRYVTAHLPEGDEGIIYMGETVLVPKVRGVEPIDPSALENMLPAYGHSQPGEEPK